MLDGPRLTIVPAERIEGEPQLPSSKYYTVRYILSAALANGESLIHYPALSNDTEALVRCCQALGARLDWADADHQHLRIKGVGRPQASGPVRVDAGNAGAVLRLFLGVGSLLPDITFFTSYSQSLGKRPNRELLTALRSLGAEIQAVGDEGYLPIHIHGGGLRGGHIQISGARSSQYLSSLLFLAPLLKDGLEIEVVDGLKSRPLIEITLNVLDEAGITVKRNAFQHFSIPGDQHYRPQEYTLPGDYPSAAALISACLTARDPQSRLRLTRLRVGEEDGEALLQAFNLMGADLEREGETLTIQGGRRLRGIKLDGDPVIDSIPVLVAAACFAEGESVFYNIENLHYKESDRINDLCNELKKAGCAITPQRDAIIVQGRPQGIEGGVNVDGHHDHRVLMALAIAGIGSRKGLKLQGTEHISKSYPTFFETLSGLGVEIRR